MTPECDRCGATAERLYDDCPECGPVWLCGECRKVHQGERLIETQGFIPEGETL